MHLVSRPGKMVGDCFVYGVNVRLLISPSYGIVAVGYRYHSVINVTELERIR